MKHFIIIDDASEEAKNLIADARKILGISILSEEEIEKAEDGYMIDAIDRGLRSEVADMQEVYRILDEKRKK